MKGPPPPKDGDVFQAADSSGDGSISKTELTTLASGIEKVTGKSINVDDALSSYDSNQDGGLSGDELLQMMKGYGFSVSETQSGDSAASSARRNHPARNPTSASALCREGFFRVSTKQR